MIFTNVLLYFLVGTVLKLSMTVDKPIDAAYQVIFWPLILLIAFFPAANRDES